MRNREVGGAFVQTLERQGVANEDCPGFFCLVGVGGELTGIEGKPFSTVPALISLLPPGESTLDEISIDITAARAFGVRYYPILYSDPDFSPQFLRAALPAVCSAC